MCNYSSYIFSEGVKQGEKQGEKRGEKRGRDEGIVLGAIGIMRDDGVAEEKIMQRIMKKYQVSEDDAKRLMDEEKELV